jgi:predicted glycoside hydrolase/deacetylase ChbG (UPF0249 family)
LGHDKGEAFEVRREKLLIVNADDCGFSEEIDSAVEACYRAGKITGTSLMAGGRSFSHAAGMLKKNGISAAGVHLTLTGSLSPCTKDLSEIKTLCPGRDIFCAAYGSFALNYFMGRIKPEHIRREFVSQIEKVRGAGLELSHLDSHEHIHALPGIFGIVAGLAKEYKIPYVRVPLENISAMQKNFSLKNMARYGALRAVLACAEPFKGLAERGIASNGRFLGHFHAGSLNDEILCSMMAALKEGVNELAVHPAIFSEKFTKGFPWYANAASEMNAILKGDWHKKAAASGIKLVTHAGAARASF